MKDILNESIKLATKWQTKALTLIDKDEKRFQEQINSMLKNRADEQLLIDLLDQSFRASSPDKAAKQIKYIFKKYGIASFFTFKEKLLINLFLNTTLVSSISVPLFIDYLRKTTKRVVMFGEKDELNRYLTKRESSGYDVNINIIGEVILSEHEAEKKINEYIDALKNPHITYISIKISTIFSQINLLDRDNTINLISKKLEKIYEIAIKNKTKDGKAKFINLDMEEYRDIDLTVSAFINTLSLEKFKNYKAGIVIQAYIPESYHYMQKIIKWAKERVSNGGSPIKVRIVKGANKEMEETESSLKHWQLATYERKIDTDSNFKKLLNLALNIENIKAVNIGIGSHNVFDVAYTKVLAEQNGVLDYIKFEMLEGIATNNRDVIKEEHGVLLYAPTAKKEHFINSIGYLVRRFDENTSDDNFLRYNFNLTPNSDSWNMLKEKFVESYNNINQIQNSNKRVQNRLKDTYENIQTGEFIPEPDSDFTISDNLIWADNVRKKYKNLINDPLDIPIVINNNEVFSENKAKAIDKSQDHKTVAKISMADEENIKTALESATKDKSWSEKNSNERATILKKVANNFRTHRGDLIGIAMAEVGKVFTEVDIEVSEAIDFLEFYPYSKRVLEEKYNSTLSPKGVGVVISPWNFPVAIPTGGVVATLTTGNNCIIKPSTLSAVTAYYICKLFWDAGVSKTALQYLPTSGEMANKYVIPNKSVDFIIFTGSDKTAEIMLKTNNKLFLSAETGGKNATIVTAYADRDQAIKNILISAFNNSGQKCSATSLLILEEEVYNDKNFLNMLCEATKSLNVGSVWDFKNVLGTLSGSKNKNLDRAIDMLEDGEVWLLKPKFLNKEKTIITPGIKIGTKKGYFTHMNELFAPILSIMCAKDLDEAISLVNSTGFGLTSGLESLNKEEQIKWSKNIKAGNLYINRSTTGAIVFRQQFGGIGKSAYGAGKKAGGINYITQFANININKPINDINIEDTLFADIDKTTGISAKELSNLKIVTKSYINANKSEFLIKHDHFKIRGESNEFMYIPYSSLLIRVNGNELLCDIIKILIASQISNIKDICISIRDENSKFATFLQKNKTIFIKNSAKVVYENENKFLQKIKEYEQVRYLQKDSITNEAFKEASLHMKFLNYKKVIDEGRFELLNYHKEQVLTISHHRYGNINLLEHENK